MNIRHRHILLNSTEDKYYSESRWWKGAGVSKWGKMALDQNQSHQFEKFDNSGVRVKKNYSTITNF